MYVFQDRHVQLWGAILIDSFKITFLELEYVRNPSAIQHWVWESIQKMHMCVEKSVVCLPHWINSLN